VKVYLTSRGFLFVSKKQFEGSIICRNLKQLQEIARRIYKCSRAYVRSEKASATISEDLWNGVVLENGRSHTVTSESNLRKLLGV